MYKIINSLWSIVVKIIHYIIIDILHIKMTGETWENFLQFVKFGIVGVSNSVISYILYVVALLFLQNFNVFPTFDYIISQVISFLLSVLWSFYWNKKYVFTENEEPVPWMKALLKTYISYAFTGLFLNSVLSILWVQILHIPKLISPIINLIIGVPINFLLNKFWAFSEK